MKTAMTGPGGVPMLVHDWSPGVERTWISYPGEVPEDFPEEFSVDDMMALDLEPDYEGMERARRQKAVIDSWREQ